ncbi:hydroperoxide isomerase ALOXE3 [Alligator sinensis]|uniref:Hydroperoxide isomerase ALOXE3 n=1 Tax=Alligator sinensis TaxID=38654 RepID=A0A1U8DXM0_ALLSI|nr:hydroperoxide isomerase ALOXE3 [Alligator sinensis]
MALYKVQVTTGKWLLAGTLDSIYITLVGTEGQSPKHLLDKFGLDFTREAVSEYTVPCEKSLGPILLIRVSKEPHCFLPENIWYCNIIRVTSPGGETYNFPCYQWIEGYRTFELPEGTAKTSGDDTHPLLQKHRREEVVRRKERYQAFESKLKGYLECPYSWKKLEDIQKIFSFYQNNVSEYVAKHWKEDAFFGYQFLNGVNPIVIQKCTKLPENFPVTQEMVAISLGKATNLSKELQNGTIYLANYKILEGISTTKVNEQQQYIAAPLCLLHQKPSGEVIPLAIQLSQHPGPDSPIFLPSDPEWLWTLAKTWVRNAEFHVHEGVTHLLCGHLIPEVFAVATLRLLPMCHPLYKLLTPHMRYSIHITIQARTLLLSPRGVFDLAIATGRVGLVEVLSKALKSISYTTLCLPDNLKARGVENLKNYYFRDDALKIWEAVESFVSGIIGYYYPSDTLVQEDHELQAWVGEVFTKGFLGRQSSGIPSSLKTKAELTKFMTMVIYTCSAYHAAVNSGQFEMGTFMPNFPSTMRKPPPRTKDPVTLQEFLDTIPAMNSTSLVLSVLWVLRNENLDMRSLGTYPDEHFTEQEPKQLIMEFQWRLAKLSQEIAERNKGLDLPYTYLDPPNIENSAAV